MIPLTQAHGTEVRPRRGAKIARLLKDSRAECLQDPLARARDLVRLLSQQFDETAAKSPRSIDALRAFERLISKLPEVETPAGLRSFRRELYRTWATVLDAREIVSDGAHVRVFDEVEASLETAHTLVFQFEKRGCEPSRR